MAITIKDVAKEAGVTHTTVSWVIHNDKRISDETKKRVLKAIKKLDYRPNLFARALVGAKTDTIAVVTSFFSGMFELDIIRGIEDVIQDTNYNISQYATRGKEKIKKELFESIVSGNRADAVICLNLKPSPGMIKEFAEKKIPLVLIEESQKGATTVKTDNYKGAYMAAEYLAKKGKKNIALMSGRIEGEEAGLSPQERLEGFRAGLKDNGIELKKTNIYESSNYYFEDGVRFFKEINSKPEKIDAVFSSAGDIVAMGFIQEAKKHGVKMPEDISVVGFDDIFVASMITPQLTTIRQHIAKMGAEAFKMAVQELENKELKPGRTLIMQPELIVRESA